MSNVHPTLKVLGMPVIGEENSTPFADMATAETPLGVLSFTRYRAGWSWSLETVTRAPDDFDGVQSDCPFAGLEAAATNADRQLRSVISRARAIVDMTPQPILSRAVLQAAGLAVKNARGYENNALEAGDDDGTLWWAHCAETEWFRALNYLFRAAGVLW